MTLKVTPDQVRAKAGEIKNYKVTMENIVANMKSEVQRLPAEYWASRSGTNYAERFQTVETNVLRALSVLLQHVNNLRDAADKYDALERAQDQKVSNLSTKNIF